MMVRITYHVIPKLFTTNNYTRKQAWIEKVVRILLFFGRNLEDYCTMQLDLFGHCHWSLLLLMWSILSVWPAQLMIPTSKGWVSMYVEHVTLCMYNVTLSSTSHRNDAHHQDYVLILFLYIYD